MLARRDTYYYYLFILKEVELFIYSWETAFFAKGAVLFRRRVTTQLPSVFSKSTQNYATIRKASSMPDIVQLRLQNLLWLQDLFLLRRSLRATPVYIFEDPRVLVNERDGSLPIKKSHGLNKAIQ